MKAKEAIFHLNNSSYAEFVSQYIALCMPTRTVHTIESINVLENISTVLLSPSPTIDSLKQLKKCVIPHRYILLTDLNHQYFSDLDELLQSIPIQIIISPFKITNRRVYKCRSLFTKFALNHLHTNSNKNHDYIFISQPLIEDRGDYSLNQHALIREAIELVREKECLLFIKRHPREEQDLPFDIINSKHVKLWEGDLAEAFSYFRNWIGYNSLPLLAAREIGLNTLFWNKKSGLFQIEKEKV
ncbi:MAG: hypothetical protein CME71_12760 [Halobacteriovorax sp.]|nr:hypothetical protein [Halobacteriovorax sp.]|tara:strand:+ start:930 stop:1658 length:729 start_codon:yes stop_codon:yes gene_type:complete